MPIFIFNFVTNFTTEIVRSYKSWSEGWVEHVMMGLWYYVVSETLIITISEV